jgi:hypothetical protein
MAITLKFRKLKRQQCKASIMIQGLSGKGKSGLGLAIGIALADGEQDKVYTVDTENGSLDLYEGLNLHTGTKVDGVNTCTLTVEDGFTPHKYADLRDQAIADGAKTVILDSISHAWQYKGGILDMVTTIQTKGGNSNKYAAWGDPQISAEKAALMDLIRNNKVHIITTVRVKEKMEIATDETTGRTGIRSLGEQQIQMPDLKYEPDLVLDMVTPGSGTKMTAPKAKIIKSRYAIFTEGEEYEFTVDMLEQLRTYLAEGADPEELLEMQRKDYVNAIQDFLNEDKANRQPMWNILKENAGLKDKKLGEIQLHDLKRLFSQLIA